jgi:hypothetical protein
VTFLLWLIMNNAVTKFHPVQLLGIRWSVTGLSPRRSGLDLSLFYVGFVVDKVGQSSASHRGDSGWISGYFMWDLWWTKSVSRRVLTTETRVGSQVILCGICGGQSRSVADFSPRKPGLDSRLFYVGLWLTKWNWDRLLSEYFVFIPAVSFQKCSKLIHSSINGNTLSQ